MKNKAQDLITIVLYISFTVIFSFLIIQNIESPWTVIFLSGLFMASFTMRNFFLYESPRYRHLGRLNMVFDALLILAINYFDRGGISFTYYLIILSDAAINYSMGFASLLMPLGLMMYALGLIAKFGFNAPIIVPRIFFNILPFGGVYAASYIVRYFLRQNELIERTLRELTVKTLDQERTYGELKRAYEKLEEMTVLKERNRIAREIHDTVGHTLTTVLVEMEIGRKIASRDVSMALEKFTLAQEQVRKGLNDLRDSVKILEKGDELMDFIPSLESLIKDTEKHTGVVVKSCMSLVSDPSEPLKRTLYRALQEGLTNGIRHGKSTAFLFKLTEANHSLEFCLEDNGVGCSSLIFGFGLKSMKERVLEHGGKLRIDSPEDGGLGLYISVPI